MLPPLARAAARRDPEGGDAGVEGAAQELGLPRKPRKALVLVRVHRASEDHDRVVGLGLVRRAPERHRPAFEPVAGAHGFIVEDATLHRGAVGDRQDTHAF
jgi:hypothetical protein